MILEPTLEMALDTCPEREASSKFSAWNCFASSSLLGSKWCLKWFLVFRFIMFSD